MKKLYLFLILLFAFAAGAKAQNSAVLKGGLDTALNGRKVWINFWSTSSCNKQDSTTTNSSGQFTYNLNLGTCASGTIVVNVIGCASAYDTLTLYTSYDSSKNGDTLLFNFDYCDTGCTGFYAGFSYGRTGVHSKTVNFYGYAYPTAQKFNWNFAGAGTSTAPSPSYTFSGFGWKTVKLKAQDTIKGCIDSVSQNVYIPYSDSIFIKGQLDTAINGKAIFFSQLIPGWGVHNQTVYTNSSGQYSGWFTVRDSAGTVRAGTISCFGDTSYNTGLYHHYHDTAEIDLEYCPDTTCNSFSVNFTSSVPAFSKTVTFTKNAPLANKYLWKFGNGNTSASGSPVHTYASAGSYSVKFIAWDTVNGCSDSITKNITIYHYDSVYVRGQLDTPINNKPVKIYSVYWWGADHNTPKTVNTNSSGQYGTWFYVRDSAGTIRAGIQDCNNDSAYNTGSYYWYRDTIDIDFIYCPTPCTGFTAGFSHYDSMHFVGFYNTSSANANHFKWTFGDSSSPSYQENPTHIYSTDGTYTVCLIATDTINGCSDTICKNVVINVSCYGFYAWFSDSVSGKTAYFKNQSSSNANYYKWTFGDSSSPSYLKNPSHTYASNGTYTVCLIVMDTLHGCADTICRNVVISTSCTGFQADFNKTIYTPDSAAFTNVSSASANHFSWTFGDGGTSLAKNPGHKYIASGTYTVCLIAKDTLSGCADTTCKTVTINNCSGFTAGFTSVAGYTTATFTNTSSANANKFEWDFGDATTSTAKNPVHNYGGPGTVTVCLIAEDTIKNCKDTLCKSVRIGYCYGFYASFSDSVVLDSAFFASGAPGNANTHKWYFGDGQTSTAKNPAHKYADGNYTVCLVIRDTINGCYDSSCQNIVINTACNGFSANFNAGAFDSAGIFKAAFYDASTFNANHYKWTFGDASAPSFAKNPLHIYATTGTYTVCLVARDTVNGCVDSICKSLVVNPSCTGFAANFYANTYQNQASLSNTSSSWATNYTWDFGDGNFATTKHAMHNYAADGNYTVCLMASDSVNGCGDTICKNITIDSRSTIYGQITLDSTANMIDSGTCRVYLIKADSIGSDVLLTAIDSTTTIDSGWYSFRVPNGRYFIKAALLSTSSYYSNYLPTYGYQSAMWAWAAPVWVTALSSTHSMHIPLIQGTNPGGSGFIGGLISVGANKTGDPMEGIEVLLLSSSGVPITYTYTDANGEYEFANLAYGTYRVLVEIPGKPSEEYVVTLDAGNPGSTHRNFDVNSKNIKKSATTGIKEVGNESLAFYPNPATTEITLALEMPAGGDAQVLITDIAGKTLQSSTHALYAGKNTLTLDVEALSNGVYIINVKTAGGNFTGRAIINK